MYRERVTTDLPVTVCCEPLTQAPLSVEQAVTLAARLKALADPARLRLISLLAASPTGDVCVCDLTEPLDLTQPIVSHHLKVLHDAGLVTREKRSTWAYYSVVPEALGAVARAIAPPL
ncbi:MAG: metalloregulator ArsR/SmtB family transcription factor [Actinobacteria bacterium]|nr:metalloregulator ArsR/SmtB family transcription factor [Actinomycetota bacterium]